MEISKLKEAIVKDKASGTRIFYRLFDEYEININELPPGTTQDWHFHKKKEEVILIIKGAIDVNWMQDGHTATERLDEGDLVRVEDTPHCFINHYKNPCTCVCFKLVLSGQSKRDILAGDKYPFDAKAH